mgnify:CR=1 FL=1
MTDETPKISSTGIPIDQYPMRSPTVETDCNRTEEELQAKAEWEYMLDTGQIINRNPPPSPEVVAAREANDRLFRSFPHNRLGTW